jgi:hypothetical protein
MSAIVRLSPVWLPTFRTPPYIDQGYTGARAAEDAAAEGITLEVVKLPEAKRGFVLLPRRWVVERSFAWATRCRRLVKDYERLSGSARGPSLTENVGKTTMRAVRFDRYGGIDELDVKTVPRPVASAGRVAKVLLSASNLRTPSRICPWESPRKPVVLSS